MDKRTLLLFLAALLPIHNSISSASSLAHLPSPTDGAQSVSPNVLLGWKAGDGAASHDVYLGAEFARVDAANNSSVEFQGNQANCVYAPQDLELGHTYHWRIDEIDSVPNIHKGSVWTFSVHNECQFLGLLADMNHSCHVDLQDFLSLALSWLNIGAGAEADISPIGGDGIVDAQDLTTLGTQWLSSSPYPVDSLTDSYEKAAQYILRQTGTSKLGYCVVFGAGRGRLAYELAKRSDLTLVGAEANANEVNAGRSFLEDADFYGNRITLHVNSLDALDYSDYFAALVVSDRIIADGLCTGSASEMFRMIRPHGQALIGQPAGCPNPLSSAALQSWIEAGNPAASQITYSITDDANGLWVHLARGPLPGAGAWTHQWADLGNTACSGDTRITDNQRVLWFGNPGPRALIDRNWRGASSLYQNGRMVTPGDDRVICNDAYNGAHLWEVLIPQAARIGTQRDAGWIAVDGHNVYAAAQDYCLKIDLAAGQTLARYSPPSAGMDWGYLAVDNGRLYGSTQKTEASWLAYQFHQQADTGSDIHRFNDTPITCSRSLFCMDSNNGNILWTYDTAAGLDGNPFVIFNPAICIADDRSAVFFLESYSPAAVAAADAEGRATATDFCSGPNEYLVKLNQETGAVLWRRQYDLPFQHIAFLCYDDGIVLASGTYTAGSGDGTFWYHYRACAADDGMSVWT